MAFQWSSHAAHIQSVFSPWQEQDGYTLPIIEAAEQALGLPLPAMLKNFYHAWGRRTDLTRTRETMLNPDQLTVRSGEVIFVEENQAIYVWAIPCTALHRTNPPVYAAELTEGMMTTPQQFYSYFSSLARDFPAPNWAAGYQAAELWVQYHTTPSPNLAVLQAVIHHLFPYREKGSYLLHFWELVVHEVAQLPFSLQKPLWQTIYTTDPHPSRPLKQRESVFHMLAEWEHLVSVSMQRSIEAPEIQQLAGRCGPTILGERESFTLASALSTWLERQCPTPVFLTEVFAQLPVRELPS